MSQSQLRGHVTSSIASRTGLNQDAFYVVISALMLLVVLTGFAPTFTLRPFFDAPAFPAYVYVHGTISTCWFVILLVQTLLIRNRQVAIHRKLGILGATVGASALILALVTNLRVPSRVAATQGSIDEATLQDVTGFVIANMMGLLLFASALLLAILLRQKPEIHKRLMLWASLFLIGPAFGRISRWPVFGETPESVFVFVCTWVVIASFIVRDLWLKRRVHWVTVSLITSVLVLAFASYPVSTSEAVRDWVRSLL
jgi:hypothetical protein